MEYDKEIKELHNKNFTQFQFDTIEKPSLEDQLKFIKNNRAFDQQKEKLKYEEVEEHLKRLINQGKNRSWYEKIIGIESVLHNKNRKITQLN